MVNLWATYWLLRSLEKSMEFPRTRGGDPADNDQYFDVKTFSPHTRG